ncbi:MAG: protein kinase [Candidatus Promineifilaceae bacterium]
MSSTLIANRYQINSRITDLIGRGGMGDVFRAVDSHNGQTVAIKHLKTELVFSNPDMLRRFNREGQALRRLNHPNIVSILTSIEEDDQHYLVMEYVPGGSLHELLRKEKQLPVDRVLKIGLELADALARAHHLEIIHRDIKPANVLLAEDGTPRLTDFGVAHIGGLQPITQTGVLTGTYSYLSPEACNGGPIDVRTDIWAFGVLLYEMLAGRRPFEESQVGAMIYAILTRPVPDLAQFRPDVPEALSNLIHKMLEKDRNHRLGSMRMVGAQLEAIIAALRGDSSNAAAPRFDTTPPAQPAPAIGPRHNLPTPPTPFIGRDEEISEVITALNDPDCRLLSLIGPGGMGKTRLAIEVGLHQVENFRHGVRFIGLAPLNTPDLLVPAIAEALSFSFFNNDEPKEQLLNYLKGKELLLILDNFEHLLDGVDLVSEILAAAPHIKILVTSRETLNLWEEWNRPVRGMSYPKDGIVANPDDYCALQLFANRAKRVRVNFDLHSELEHVVRISRLVEGMPLGIELATTWLRTLTTEQIAQEIQNSLDFLSTTLRNIAPRHRSIRAVFDYSWELLTEKEKAVFRRLAVFQGGFHRKAAEQVAQADLLTLTSLVNKSLLYEDSEAGLDTSHPGGITYRYYLHELLKQYAAAKLNELPEEQNQTLIRHAIYYTQFLTNQEPLLKYNRRQRAGLDAIGEEMENIRCAWKWATTQIQEHPELASYLEKAATTLFIYLENRTRNPENALLFHQTAEAFRQTTSLPPVTRARFIASMEIRQAIFLFRTNHHEESTPLWQRALATLTELLEQGELDAAARLSVIQDRILAQTFLSFFFTRSQGRDMALAKLAEAESWAQEIGDRWALSRALNVQGIFYTDLAQSMQCYQDALAIAREIGDLIGMAIIMGNLTTMIPDRDEINTLLNEALEIHQALGNQYMIGHTYFQQGVAYIPQGMPHKARSALGKALAIFAEIAATHLISNIFDYLSELAWGMGELEVARQYLNDQVQRAQSQGDIEYTIKAMYKSGCFLIETAPEEETRAVYRSAVSLLPQLQQAHARAEALDALGNFALILGEYGAAKKHFEENLHLFKQAEDRAGQGWSLRNFGLISYDLGDYAAAAKHFQASLDIHRQVSFPWAQAQLLHNLGQVAAACGDLDQAARYYREGLAQSQGIWGTSLSLELLASWGILLFKLEEPEQAYEHLLATTQHPTFLPVLVSKKVRDKAYRILAELEARLPKETRHDIQSRGRTADDLRHTILGL